MPSLPPSTHRYSCLKTLSGISLCLLLLLFAAIPHACAEEGADEVMGTNSVESVSTPTPVSEPVTQEEGEKVTREQDGSVMESTVEGTKKEDSKLPTPSSTRVVIKLIDRLIERGILPKEDAEDLLIQAEKEAADEAEKTAKVAVDAARKAVEEKQAEVEKPAPKQHEVTVKDSAVDDKDDEVTVIYIPEYLKDQLREEIREDITRRASSEEWTYPRNLPEWVSRFRLIGDVRLRYEGDYFPPGNDNSGVFPNFNSINTGAPFDTTGSVFSPQLNVDQDRTRLRLRARGGAEVSLDDVTLNNFTAGFRLGTGESNSPVSENQSLGLANGGQGGNFSRYAIWVDRAYLRYEVGDHNIRDLQVNAGRFDNPFFGTSLMWANDLAFDGISVRGRYMVNQEEQLRPFVTAGIFPVFNNDFNFSSIQPAKFKSRDKWLMGGQVGFDWLARPDLNFKMAAGFFDFQSIEGKRSDPFVPQNTSDQSNADNSRPSFAQKGNTYMAIREITSDASNGFGANKQFQYFGLASPFRVFQTTARLDYSGFDPIHLWVDGDFVKNLGFDYNNINAIAVNNRQPNFAGTGTAPFVGGDMGWVANFHAGNAILEKLWDWNINAGYRYVESDSVVDGFCDSDFGGGGTNLKGYTLSANLGLAQRVWLTLSWFSANSIEGPTFKQDTIQFDVNGRF